MTLKGTRDLHVRDVERKPSIPYVMHTTVFTNLSHSTGQQMYRLITFSFKKECLRDSSYHGNEVLLIFIEGHTYQSGLKYCTCLAFWGCDKIVLWHEHYTSQQSVWHVLTCRHCIPRTISLTINIKAWIKRNSYIYAFYCYPPVRYLGLTLVIMVIWNLVFFDFSLNVYKQKKSTHDDDDDDFDTVAVVDGVVDHDQ